MSHGNRITMAILFSAMTLPAAQTMAQEPTADMRSTARTLASLERPLEKRDLNGYCTTMHSDPAYTGYVTRACQNYVKNNMKKAEDCSDANIKQEVKKDSDRCLATSPDEFIKTVAQWRTARAEFVKNTGAKGIDSEKLIAEERAKLK